MELGITIYMAIGSNQRVSLGSLRCSLNEGLVKLFNAEKEENGMRQAPLLKLHQLNIS